MEYPRICPNCKTFSLPHVEFYEVERDFEVAKQEGREPAKWITCVNCNYTMNLYNARPIPQGLQLTSSSSSTASSSGAILSASSVDQTALAITQDLANRVDRGERTQFEYKIEDRSGNKHS